MQLKNYVKENKRRAFTLAETMITLMIIGMIAMITIPNLLHNYKKHLIETQLKNSYLTLIKALNMAQADSGNDLTGMIVETNSYGQDDRSRTKYFFTNFLKPYLNTSKIEQLGESNKIFPKFLTLLNGTTENTSFGNMAGATIQVELTNGVRMAVKYVGSVTPIIFIIDVNGKNAPNQVGYDIFYFSIRYDWWTYYKAIITSGAGTVNPRSSAIATCSQQGYDCGWVILKNNWKIPKEYPINF